MARTTLCLCPRIYSQTKPLPILTYDRVASEGSTSLARFRVTPQDFELQIRYLKEAGYDTSTFDDWRVAAECRKPCRAESFSSRLMMVTLISPNTPGPY